MKKWLIIPLLFIAWSCNAQKVTIKGLAQIIISNNNGGSTIAVDTSKRNLIFSPIMHVAFDATRPNLIVTVTGPLFFSIDSVIPSYSGTVTFVNTGSWPITFNGVFTGSIPTTTFTANYTYSSGTQWH